MKHTHDAIVHTHEHAHMVHYLRHGNQWEHMAASHVNGTELRRRLEAAGIAVRGAPARGLAEEAEAYKDVNAVVAAAEGGGLCRKIARLVPLGVVKG